MKKLLILITGLCLTGCGSNQAAVNTLSPHSENPPASENSSSGADAEQLDPVGTYVSTNETFSPDELPTITFSENGTFYLNENMLNGMGEYRGSYKYDGTYYDCTVEEIGFFGYGGNVPEVFSFIRFDANTIVLLDLISGSQPKDVFVKNTDSNEPFDQQGGTIKPAQEVGEINTTRTYISDSDMFSDPYRPTLILETDGTFELTENLFEGMGHYKGTYTVDDIYLTLNVESTDFSGFAGDNVKVIEFEALSEDVFQLMTDLCGSVKFDYWYLDIPQ